MAKFGQKSVAQRLREIEELVEEKGIEEAGRIAEERNLLPTASERKQAEKIQTQKAQPQTIQNVNNTRNQNLVLPTARKNNTYLQLTGSLQKKANDYVNSSKYAERKAKEEKEKLVKELKEKRYELEKEYKETTDWLSNVGGQGKYLAPEKYAENEQKAEVLKKEIDLLSRDIDNHSDITIDNKIKYGTNLVAKSFVDGGERLADFLVGNIGTAVTTTQKTLGADEQVVDRTRNAFETLANVDVAGAGFDKVLERNAKIAGIDQNAMPSKLAYGIGTNVFDLATSVGTGGASIYGSVGGGHLQESLQDGATLEQATVKADVIGAVIGKLEGVFNKTFGVTGNSALSKVASKSKTVSKFINDLSKTGAGKSALKFISEALEGTSEIGEEFAEEILDDVTTKIIYDRTREIGVTSDEAKEIAIMTALSTFALRGVTGQSLTNTEINEAIEISKKYIDENKISTEKLPVAREENKNIAKQDAKIEENASNIAQNAQVQQEIMPNTNIAPYNNEKYVAEDVKAKMQQVVDSTNKISKSDVKLEFTKLDGNIKAQTDGNTIKIDISKASLGDVIHEITHNTETSKGYLAVSDYILTELDKRGELQSIKEEMNTLYSSIYEQEGRTFTEKDLENEIVANYTEKFANDEAFVNKITQTDRNFAQKIYDWIKEKVNYYKTVSNMTDEQRAQYDELKRAEKIWMKALEDNENSQLDASKYSFAGQKGMNNAINNDYRNKNLEEMYNKALSMSKVGVNNETIRKTTNWYQDKNGDWKFEFSDKDMSLKNIKYQENKVYKLGDILEHDTLFMLYPELANYDVEFASMKPLGRYSKITKQIKLNSKLLNRKLSTEGTLIHEIQHAIQDIEGFENGFTSKLSKEYYYNRLGEIEATDAKQRFLEEKKGVLDRYEIAPESSKKNPKHQKFDNYMEKRKILDKIKDGVYNYFNEKVNKNEKTIKKDRRYNNETNSKTILQNRTNTDRQDRNRLNKQGKLHDNKLPTAKNNKAPKYSLAQDTQESRIAKLNKDWELYDRTREDLYSRQDAVKEQYKEIVNSEEYKKAVKKVVSIADVNEATKTDEYKLMVKAQRLQNQINDYQDEIDIASKEMTRIAKEIDKEEKEHRNPTEAIKQAKKVLGLTNNFKEAGYMLEDGGLLDFSGRSQGSNAYNQRTMDHREINEFGYEMAEFIELGNIRLQPESNGFEMMKEPTEKQYNMLKKYIDNANGEVYIDIYKDGRMGVYDSNNYKQGTSSDKVISDLRYYFKNGNFPKQSSLAEFRYSLAKNSQVDNKGRTLSKEQQEYFKESKARDNEGRLIEVYHGTPNAGFTIYDTNKLGETTKAKDSKLGIHLTDNIYLADDIREFKTEKLQEEAKKTIYKKYNISDKEILPPNMQNKIWQEIDNLIENKASKQGEVKKQYIDIKKPFSIYADYGISEEQLANDLAYILTGENDITKTEIGEIYDDNKDFLTMIQQDYEGAIAQLKDELGTNKDMQGRLKELGYDGIILPLQNVDKTELIKKLYNDGKNFKSAKELVRGNEYIVFNSNQIKNIDNANPTSNDDIRYSASKYTPATALNVNETYATGRKEAYNHYKYSKEQGYNSIIVEEAKDLVKANNQGRRTKEQWLKIAEHIGLNTKGMTVAEIEETAYKSWFENKPNSKDNLNRQGQKYVKFTADEWINKIYESANSQKTITANGREITFDEYYKENMPMFNSKEDAQRIFDMFYEKQNQKVVTEAPKKTVEKLEKASDGKERKHYKSIATSEMVAKPGKEVAKNLLEKDRYIPTSNKKQLEFAEDRIKTSGISGTLESFREKLNSGKRLTPDDLALGERLIQEYSNSQDIDTLNQLIQDVAIIGTELGQSVQALSLIHKMTPEGQLMTLQKSINRINKAEKTDIKLTKEQTEKIVNAKGEAELNKALAEVSEEIAEQIPVKATDKLRSWRYLSMLGNPRTHIRNILSNVAMKGTMGVKNKVAGAIEDIINPGERTRTFKKATREAREFATNDAESMVDRIANGGKYDVNTLINQNKKQFDSRIMNTIADFNSNALEIEDKIFIKSAYKEALANYMTANKLTPEYLQSGTKEANIALTKAREFASYEAQVATFRQFSWLATQINQWENKNGFWKVAIGGVLPFKKTPINIAKTGIEYSPVGLAKTLTKNSVDLKKGNITANQYIDNISKGLTGTSISMLGYVLAKAGILKGSGGDDDRESTYLSGAGNQEYAIKIGDKTFTIDWLSPSAMPLLVGAEFYNSVKEDESTINATIGTMTKTLNPLVEMSMLQSFVSTLQSFSQGELDSLADMGMNMAESYAGQYVPTILGQTARVIDDTERNTYYTDKKSWEARMVRFFNKQIAKIPFASKTLQPKVDVWGDEIKREDNIAIRAVNQYLNPSYVKTIRNTEADKAVQKLYKASEDSSVLPKAFNSKFNMDSENKVLTPEENTKYAKKYGKAIKNNITQVANTREYNSLPTADKVNTIKAIYSDSNDKIKGIYADEHDIDYKATDDVDSAIKDGLSLSNAYIYRGNINSIQSEKDKSGETIAGSKSGNKAKYIMKLPTADEQKNLMLGLVSDSEIKPTVDALEIIGENNYNTYFSISNSKTRAKYVGLAGTGMNSNSLNNYMDTISSLEADKDENGNSIRNSLKNKKYEYINSLNLTANEKKLLFAKDYEPSESDKAEIIRYINGLNIDADDKYELLKQLKGVETDKYGNISW